MRVLVCRIGLIGLLAAIVFATTAEASSPGFRSGRLAHGSENAVTVVGRSFAVARLLLDGTKDPGFGRDGIARATFPRFTSATSLDALVRRDGKTFVSGYVTEKCKPARGQTCGRRLALACFTASGRLDSRFGGDGTVVFDDRAAMGAHVIGLAGGRLAVAGRTRGGLPLVVRLEADGSLDRADGGEKVLSALPGAGRLTSGSADDIVLLSGGREVASVHGSGPQGSTNALVGFTPRGRIDATGFGIDGVVTRLPAGIEFDRYGYGLAALPTGKLLIAATTSERPTRPVLVGLLANGLLDESFGNGGVAVGPSINVRFNVDVVLQADGKAVMAAATYDGSALLRFGPEGAIDASFGADGVTETMESWGSHASLAILLDGSAVLADDDRELSGLLVCRYDTGGKALFLTDL